MEVLNKKCKFWTKNASFGQEMKVTIWTRNESYYIFFVFGQEIEVSNIITFDFLFSNNRQCMYVTSMMWKESDKFEISMCYKLPTIGLRYYNIDTYWHLLYPCIFVFCTENRSSEFQILDLPV